jgi:DNA-binding transcriptional ArsR family regulator
MSLDSTFAALADPTRRALLERLETGEHTLTDLALPLPMSLMAVQKHVRVLEEAELVVTYKKGRSRHVRLRREGLEHVADWLQNTETRWKEALDRLAEVLEEEQSSR